jgi:hypothetical protein
LPPLLDRLVAPGGLVTKVDHVACSGAVADDLYAENIDYQQYGEKEPAQLDFVRKSTVLVTLSMGGNDVGFADILKDCVARPRAGLPRWGCRKPGRQANILAGKIPALTTGFPVPHRPDGPKPSLADIYTDILKKMSPNGTLIVAGYPRLFAESRNLYTELTLDGAACRVGSRGFELTVSHRDAMWLNGVADQANEAIRKSVIAANGLLQGTPAARIKYQPSSGSFTSHRVCSGSSWINGVELSSPSRIQLPVEKQQSFHPKKQGQTAYYKAVCGAIPANGRPEYTCDSKQAN